MVRVAATVPQALYMDCVSALCGALVLHYVSSQQLDIITHYQMMNLRLAPCMYFLAPQVTWLVSGRVRFQLNFLWFLSFYLSAPCDLKCSGKLAMSPNQALVSPSLHALLKLPAFRDGSDFHSRTRGQPFQSSEQEFYISKPPVSCAEVKEQRNGPKAQRPLAQRHKVNNWVGWVCLGSCSLLGGGLGAYHMLEFPSSALDLVSKPWTGHLVTCSPLSSFWRDIRAVEPESEGRRATWR